MISNKVLTSVAVALSVILSTLILFAWTNRSDYISSTPPEYGSLDSIHSNYKELLNTLRDYALDAGHDAEVNSSLMKLLNSKEFVACHIDDGDSIHEILRRTKDYKYRREVLPAKAVLGAPAVNQYWEELTDGSSRTILEYHEVLKGMPGERISIIISFDLDELHKLSRLPE